MNVEMTIQAMFDNYPAIYQSRWDCMNHLLCVIGNGYEWVDGEIVSDNRISPINNLVDEKAYQYSIIKTNHDYYKLLFKNDDRYDVQPLLENIAEEPVERNKRTWYPDVCGYSLINRVPHDIKPDWKQFVDACKELLILDGIVIDNLE